MNSLYEYTAYLNSKVCGKILNLINPTLNFGSGSVGNIPIQKFNKKEFLDTLHRGYR